jgi:hypothetical protein
MRQWDIFLFPFSYSGAEHNKEAKTQRRDTSPTVPGPWSLVLLPSSALPLALAASPLYVLAVNPCIDILRESDNLIL